MVQKHPSASGLPVLDAGKHTAPERGACLMEYVSVLGGQRFTDRPACTPKPVAVVARRVNDAVTDHARSRLALWAPELVAMGRGHGPLDDTVVLCCTTAGLVVAPHECHLVVLRERARRRLRHPWSRWLRLPAQAAVHEAFIAAMAALDPVPPAERDERLTELLAEVVRSAQVSATGPRGADRTDAGPPAAARVGAGCPTEHARNGGRR